MEYTFTPDVFLPISTYYSEPGDITVELPPVPDLAPIPSYNEVVTGLRKYNCEQGADRRWVGWYEIISRGLKRVLEIKSIHEKEKSKRKGELDAVFISDCPTGLYVFNHYMKTSHPKMSFWWKAGFLAKGIPKFRLRYASHIIMPPHEYTLWGRLNQIYNKSTNLHTDIVIVDCNDDTVVQIVSAVCHIMKGGSILIKIPLGELFTNSRLPSLIYTLRNAFVETKVYLSTADMSIGIAFVRMDHVIRSYVSHLESWARGKSLSMFSEKPADWEEFSLNYKNFLSNLVENAKKIPEGEFVTDWLNRFAVKPLDPRLTVTLSGDLSEELPDRITSSE